MPGPVIAIDGYSACGKSTLAMDLSRELHYLYLDTGAMYRAVALAGARSGTPWDDADALARLAEIEYVEREFSHPYAHPKQPGLGKDHMNR